MRTRSVLLLALLLLPLPSHAWSRLGHEIIAFLAEDQLTPQAHAGIRRLLHGRRISDGEVAGWADELARRLPGSSKWHYVNIPMGTGNYTPARDCPKADCVVAKIEEYRKTLANLKADAPVRADALRFVVHFVADAQQPLHCLDDNDRGGNEVAVEMKDHSGALSLHQVWDGVLLNDGMGRRSLKTYEGQLLTDLTPGLKRKFSGGDLKEWINQCHSDGEIIYDDLKIHGRKQVHLPDNYVRQQSGVVDLELERASVRLAIVLNEALKDEPLHDGSDHPSSHSHHKTHHHR